MIESELVSRQIKVNRKLSPYFAFLISFEQTKQDFHNLKYLTNV